MTSPATPASPPRPLTAMSQEVLLEVLPYCGLGSLTQRRATCRLWAVLVAEHEQMHPSFTSLHGSLSTLPSQAKERCPATPFLGFLFVPPTLATPVEPGTDPETPSMCKLTLPADQLTLSFSALPPGCKVIGGQSYFFFMVCGD